MNVRRTVLLALACAGLAGCGSKELAQGGEPSPLSSVDLPGWRAVADPPGIAGLAPDLSGLHATGHVDAALVRNGDAIRATSITFSTGADARRALERVDAGTFIALLFEKLHGHIERIESPRGYRVTVTRPAEPGQDTVELFALRRGRALVLVELLSAHAFQPALRDKVLGVSR